MSIAEAKTQYTPEDLLEMPDGKNYELVDGELVEKKMGWNASWIGGQLHRRLANHCHETRQAAVAPADASYQCFPDAPSKVRKPDVSAILLPRVPPEEEREGHCRVVPDLVAEVVSPNEFYYEVEDKVEDYLRAGTKLVWVINPPTRSVRVRRLDGTVEDLGEHDELSGEDVLPGFRCRVGELFQMPNPEAAK